MTIEQEAKLRNAVKKYGKIALFLVVGYVVLKVIQLALIFTYLQGYYYGCAYAAPKVLATLQYEAPKDVAVFMDQCKAATMHEWESN